MMLGGLSLLLGYHTRHGAMLLFGFTVIVTVLMHNFWTLHDAVERAADYALFARNVAIGGALLLLVGMGPGPFALDNRFEQEEAALSATSRRRRRRRRRRRKSRRRPSRSSSPAPSTEAAAALATEAPMAETKPAVPSRLKELPEYHSGE